MKKTCSAILTIALVALVCSCKSMILFPEKDGGHFQQDPAAEAAFLKFQVSPGYEYYTYGPQDFPDVLLGLDNKYKLEPGVFTPVPSMTPELMKSLLGRMQHRAYTTTDVLRGFYIVKNDGGDIIGTWYGPFLFTSIVRIKDGAVSISYPDFPNRPFGRTSGDNDFQ